MKKELFTLLVGAILATGTIFVGCQSSAEKEKDAAEKVVNAKEELNDAQREANEAQKEVNLEAQKEVNAEEWKAFKEQSDARIKANEEQIKQLKMNTKTSKKVIDVMYTKRIDTLEQRNVYLNERIKAYDKGQTGWEKFKVEFNGDMDELGKSLKDFTVTNKK